MGEKVTIEPFRDSYDGSIVGSADEEAYNDVHAVTIYCGDAATLCGIPFVDDGLPIETRKAVSCRSCISILENQQKYKKRNGKWY